MVSAAFLLAGFAWACVSSSELTIYPGKGSEGTEFIRIIEKDPSKADVPVTMAAEVQDDDGGVNLLSIAFLASSVEESELAQFKDSVLASLRKQRAYWEKWIAQNKSKPKAATMILVVQSALDEARKIEKEILEKGLQKSHLMPLAQKVVKPILEKSTYGYKEFKNGKWAQKVADPKRLDQLFPNLYSSVLEIDEDGERPVYRGIGACNVDGVIGGKATVSGDGKSGGEKGKPFGGR